MLLLYIILSLNIELKEHATVTGSKLYLKDLVTADSQIQLKTRQLDRIPVGFAPQSGQWKSINRSYLDGVLSRENIELKWSGAEACRVSRKTIKNTSELLEATVTEWLQQYAPLSGKYTLEKLQAPVPHNLPKGEITFAIYSAAKSLRPGMNVLRVDAYVNDVKKKSFSVSIQLAMEVLAARTTRYIDRHETIQAGDVVWETIKTNRLLSPLVTKDQLSGCQTKIAIPAGTVLDWRKLEKTPLIERNQLVYVSAVNGSLSIRMQAKSMDRGGIGEVVRLKNIDSGKTFLATVSGTGEAKLRL
ncbi:MAG: flagella basal body P-ring formation protein FlgA [Acidobacteria bacterium]|nr:MAG: flagella basal body P-ring formation protein FlgA [Acidobacteriota bacterium]PIE89014.1 MAG: flagella basal body P-ring formation protein FlgA [Acidobacteriota bacterium]